VVSSGRASGELRRDFSGRASAGEAYRDFVIGSNHLPGTLLGSRG
jgi:hypothetical protein